MVAATVVAVGPPGDVTAKHLDRGPVVTEVPVDAVRVCTGPVCDCAGSREGQCSSTTGCRVVTQVRPQVGTSQPGCPTFSPPTDSCALLLPTAL